MKQQIKNNRDFLFIYEGINCNPNGDPETENQPRLDVENSINLVTDVRLKRYIRDYLKSKNHTIFVDLEESQHVNPKQKLSAYIDKLTKDQINDLFGKDNPKTKEILKIFDALKDDKLSSKLLKKKKDDSKEDKSKEDNSKKTKELQTLTNELVSALVKKHFMDIKLFGSAFAIDGVTQTFTGPIQLTWGYSLNKVKMLDSTAIVTIMEDASSTFGRDYRLYYTLLAFHGTINKNCAYYTNLTEDEIDIFRDAIWNSITALPTRSKLNQYPKLYLEIIYNENYGNGQFGDLRNYIKVTPKEGLTYDAVRKLEDLDIDFSNLQKLIKENIGNDKIINKVHFKCSNDLNFSL